MIIIRNKIIPFKGFKAVNIFGILFVRDSEIDKETLTHEEIHTKQMQEMAYIFFYLWYIVEWLVELCISSKESAYRRIGFEREAYSHEGHPDYPRTRKHYAWFKLMKA